MTVNWKGVFPAITTQFHLDYSLDLDATARHLEAMIGAGIHGVVLLGTVGENTALEYDEKLDVVQEMKRAAAGASPYSPAWPSTPRRSAAASRATPRRSGSTG